MSEILDIFTEDGQNIGTISKKEYYSLKENDNLPWIKCCSCFVIDKSTNKILFEKRGKRFLDPGKLDLCSGHIRSGEVPQLGMIRELGEELGIKTGIASLIVPLGNVKLDYTSLSDETNRKNLKCFVSLFALKIKDANEISIDNKEVVRYGFLSLEDAIGFIQNSMTRIPYEDNLKDSFEPIFENLKKFINNQKEITDISK